MRAVTGGSSDPRRSARSGTTNRSRQEGQTAVAPGRTHRTPSRVHTRDRRTWGPVPRAGRFAARGIGSAGICRPPARPVRRTRCRPIASWSVVKARCRRAKTRSVASAGSCRSGGRTWVWLQVRADRSSRVRTRGSSGTSGPSRPAAAADSAGGTPKGRPPPRGRLARQTVTPPVCSPLTPQERSRGAELRKSPTPRHPVPISLRETSSSARARARTPRRSPRRSLRRTTGSLLA